MRPWSVALLGALCTPPPEPPVVTTIDESGSVVPEPAEENLCRWTCAHVTEIGCEVSCHPCPWTSEQVVCLADTILLSEIVDCGISCPQ